MYLYWSKYFLGETFELLATTFNPMYVSLSALVTNISRENKVFTSDPARQHIVKIYFVFVYVHVPRIYIILVFTQKR